MDFHEEVGTVTGEQWDQLYQQVVLPEPPDVRRDAAAYLATAADTRATALVEGLLEEVGRLDTETGRLREEVTAHKVARMPEGNETRCRRCLPSAGVRVQCEDCRRIDKRAAEIRATDA